MIHAVNQIITMHVDVYRGSIQDTSIDGWMSMQLRNQMGGRPAAGQSNKKASATACACLRRQLIHGHLLHLLLRSCLHVAAEAGIRPRQREAAAGRAKRTAWARPIRATRIRVTSRVIVFFFLRPCLVSKKI
jgi:hypothetical protein